MTVSELHALLLPFVERAPNMKMCMEITYVDGPGSFVMKFNTAQGVLSSTVCEPQSCSKATREYTNEEYLVIET